MLSLATVNGARQYRWMTQRYDAATDDDAIKAAIAAAEDEDEAELQLWAETIRIVRSKRDLSQEVAGARFGISGQGWRKYEAGVAPGIFRPGTQRRIAFALGVPADYLRSVKEDIAQGLAGARGHTSPSKDSNPQYLEISERVQAGAWISADEAIRRQSTIAPDPRYNQASQWLAEAVGDSAQDLRIFDGDLVHLVDAEAIRYNPISGDVVEVERTRFDSSERELSIRQVEVTPTAIILWARSPNPRWKDPIVVTSEDASSSTAPRIRALVAGVTRRY
jgi:transcriptional regulator with XRE-family HTH domain